jgi:hypothetical protein
MSNAIRFLLSLRLARGVFGLLALLAVSAALAQAFCDLQDVKALHHDDCCASLEAGVLAVPSTAAIPTGTPAPVLAPAAWPLWRPAALMLSAHIPPDRPPLTRPYHARSARILI